MVDKIVCVVLDAIGRCKMVIFGIFLSDVRVVLAEVLGKFAEIIVGFSIPGELKAAWIPRCDSQAV